MMTLQEVHEQLRLAVKTGRGIPDVVDGLVDGGVIDLMNEARNTPSLLKGLKQRGVYVHPANHGIRIPLIDLIVQASSGPQRFRLSVNTWFADGLLPSATFDSGLPDIKSTVEDVHDHGKAVISRALRGSTLKVEHDVVGIVAGEDDVVDPRLLEELKARHPELSALPLMKADDIENLPLGVQVLDVFRNPPSGGSGTETYEPLGRVALGLAGWSVAKGWARSPHRFHQVMRLSRNETVMTLFGNLGPAIRNDALICPVPAPSRMPKTTSLFNESDIGEILHMAVEQLAAPVLASPQKLFRDLPEVIGREGFAGVLLKAIERPELGILNPRPLNTRRVITLRSDTPVSTLDGNRVVPLDKRYRTIRIPGQRVKDVLEGVGGVVLTADGVTFDFASSMVASAYEMTGHLDAFARKRLKELGRPRLGDVRGRVTQDELRILHPDYSHTDINELRNRLEKLAEGIVVDNPSLIRVIPGVLDFIAELPQGFPLAIWTGCTERTIRTWAKRVGLREDIPVIGRDVVPEGKPNPDGLQKAFDAIGIPTQRGLFFDDSTDGLTAALSLPKPPHVIAVETLESGHPHEVLARVGDFTVIGARNVDRRPGVGIEMAVIR